MLPFARMLRPLARLNSFPDQFPELLVAYCAQIADAIEKESHHDHRGALLIDFLRKAFDIEVDEIELEKKVKAAEARGLIDALYTFVIVEVKIDLDSERADAMRELKRYFESRSRPEDYVAAVTDGVSVELYDYGKHVRECHFLRSFEIVPDDPATDYKELDELLASGQKIPPTSDDIVSGCFPPWPHYRKANRHFRHPRTPAERMERCSSRQILSTREASSLHASRRRRGRMA